jgi:hypothetical protein
MSIHLTKLKVVSTGELVDGELHDDLTLDALFEAEELWAPERVRFLKDFVHSGCKPGELPESIHWSWSLKALRVPGLKVGGLSPYRLFGIKADGHWQGLLIANAVGHVSRLPPGGKDLVYVEFVETAPWNWECLQAGRPGLYRGVGLQLFDLAVRWSVDIELGGRVGLHSLSQAETFYRDRCKMSDLGIDPSYQSLRYFEYSELQAREFLGEDLP